MPGRLQITCEVAPDASSEPPTRCATTTVLTQVKAKPCAIRPLRLTGAPASIAAKQRVHRVADSRLAGLGKQIMTSPQPSKNLKGLIIGSIGIVFGDIGTSPLYAMKETFGGQHPMPVEPERVLGVLSLMFWTIMVLVTVKYVVIIMRADAGHDRGAMCFVLDSATRYRAHRSAVRPNYVPMVRHAGRARRREYRA